MMCAMWCVGGVNASYVLWNFFETEYLSISNVEVVGTVLAPLATITFSSGAIQGAMFASNITGSGSFDALVRLAFL